MSAFEAHIINVTAHIENALKVDTKPIEFGTVFPQEYVERPFEIALSDSFKGADRVDDVEYVINQKLKPCPVHKVSCGPACEKLEPIDPTCVPDDPNAVPPTVPHNPTGWHYLSLCPYLSKVNTEADGTVPQNDVSHPSYFVPATATAPAHCQDVTTVASGKLSKAIQDTADAWVVDLKVPPVAGNVAQDWPAGCPTVDSNDKTYGCDLWIEVNNISLPDGPPDICSDQADVMLVLDRSGSIDDTELATLKTAAHAFATAMNPDGGVHMGQTSFSTNGTLDTHLTGDHLGLIGPGIDALVSGGLTNLYEGINLAKGELDNLHSHERATVPDFMVIITDGAPNQPTDEATAQLAAANEADAARAAGIQVYVVGIGVTSGTETYLKTEIADDAAHYFSAANYADLEALLEDIATCQP